MTLTFRRERATEQTGGDIVLDGPRRWVRFAAYYGTPPGSHIGYWRTNLDEQLQGVNLRIGRKIAGPCLTLFIHTHASRRHG